MSSKHRAGLPPFVTNTQHRRPYKKEKLCIVCRKVKTRTGICSGCDRKKKMGYSMEDLRDEV